MGLKRQYNVCNFGLKAEIYLVAQMRGRDLLEISTGRLGEPVSSPHVCFPVATEERYVRTLSDCIPTTHKCCRQRIEYKSYFYISTSFSLFVPVVEYTTFLPGVIRALHKIQEHYIHGPKHYIAIAL